MTDPRIARDALWRVAGQQRGYFTSAQAVEAGYSHQAQHFHARRGNWIKVDRALYRFREYNDLPLEDTDHLARWALWSRGQAVVSHLTALTVHDLGVANPAQVHLTVPPGFRRRAEALILHQAVLEADMIDDHLGFRVTTPARAIVESAADGADQDILDSAVADARERGMATSRQLLDAAQLLGPKATLAIERALRQDQP